MRDDGCFRKHSEIKEFSKARSLNSLNPLNYLYAGVSFSIPKKEKDKARKVMHPHFCRVLFSIPKSAENFVVCGETSPCLLRYRFQYLGE